MSSTHTRVHVYETFANPYLVCQQCHQPVPKWHDVSKCPNCPEESWNEPCKHTVGTISTCPSWSPVDGCTCEPTCIPREPSQ